MSATPFGADVHAGTAAAGFRAGPKTPDTLALFVCPESRRVRRVPRSEASCDHPKDHFSELLLSAEALPLPSRVSYTPVHRDSEALTMLGMC